MKIICGRHNKSIRHVCTLASCRSSLLCEECLAAFLPHTHSHKPHIMPLAQFLRISTSKGTVEHVKEVLAGLQRFGGRLSAVRDSSNALQKAAEGELAALVRVFEEEVRMLTKRMGVVAAGPVDKYERQIRSLEQRLQQFEQAKDKENGFFSSLFSGQKECQSQL